MFIDSDGKRWNKPYSRGTHFDAHGNERPNILWEDPEYRAAAGISEIDAPSLPPDVNDETHYIHHLDVPPYLEWTPKSPRQLAELTNLKLDSQIAALEQATLMPRVTREFMKILYLQQATAAGITETQLLDPADPAFSPAYKKLYDLDVEIAALRQQKVAVPPEPVEPAV